jgi:hypothetical protein
VLLLAVLLHSCSVYRKNIVDEVVLRDQNSHTGTILKTDSVNVKLMKPDESIILIPWAKIDTIGGKRLKTIWGGMNAGYYSIPYYSVLKDTAILSKTAGFQFKVGTTFRGDKLLYLNLVTCPAQPNHINFFGVGYQKYIYKSTYLQQNAFFVGSEFNFLNAKTNNGAQFTLQPYAGIERKLSDQIRIHFKWALQINFANKNPKTGANFTVGIHFLRKNFNYRYSYLNREHKVYRQ